MTHKEALRVQEAFLRHYQRESGEPRVESAALGIDQESKGFCLLARGSSEQMRLLPDRFQGMKVVQQDG